MPNHKYSIAQKLRIVAIAKARSIYAVPGETKIDRKRIREWIDNEEKLREQVQGAFRITGGGRKPACEELEEELATHITYERSQKHRVTHTMISEWAEELSDQFECDLNFSDGWVDRFMERHGFVLRAATNKPVLDDETIVERGARFILHLRQLLDEFNIARENIYSLDETALFFDHGNTRTVERRGSSHVPVSIY